MKIYDNQNLVLAVSVDLSGSSIRAGGFRTLLIVIAAESDNDKNLELGGGSEFKTVLCGKKS